jgi:hypothetical protein
MKFQDIKNKIHELVENAYEMGYEDGLKDGKESVQIDESDAYKAGLNDAWECARKMINDAAENGSNMLKKVFGYTTLYYIINHYPASEAMLKITLHEEKQKQEERACDTCQYLHGGFNSLKECANCYNNSGWTPKKMTLDEAIKHCEEVADSKCDECGAEHRQLAEWLRELKQMKGEEE